MTLTLLRPVKYRSRTDIAAAILEISLEGAIKTKIMYKAFLSFPQLKEYLGVLMEKELLEHNAAEQKYRTRLLSFFLDSLQIAAPRR